MRIKLDENVPVRLVAALIQLGHDVHTVEQEQVKGIDDLRLWDLVQREQRFLITQDLDFSDIRRFTPGTHSGLLLVRLKNPSRNALFRFILDLFLTQDISSWPGAYIVATENKLRPFYN